VIRYAVLLFSILFSTVAFSQSYTYTYVDPCTKLIKTITIPANQQNIAVTYYGQVGTFSQADFNNGVFTAWMNSTAAINSNKPCDGLVTATTTTTNLIVTNNIISTLTNITSVATMSAQLAGSVASVSTGGVSNALGNATNNSSSGSSGNSDGNSNNSNSSSANGGSNSGGSGSSGSAGSSSNNGGSSNGSGSNTGGSGGNTGGSGSGSGGNTGGSGSGGSSSGGSGSGGNTGGSGSGSGGTTGGSGSGGSGTPTGTGGTNPQQTGGNGETTTATSGGNGGTTNSVSNAAEASAGSEGGSGGSSGGSSKSGDKNRARVGSLIGTGDIVAIRSAEEGEKDQFKFTMSMTHSNTKNTFAKGFLGNFTTSINNSNITFYGAWTKKTATLITANSSMINFDKDFFNTSTVLGSKRYGKLSLMGGANFTVGKLGKTAFTNLSAVGGGFYLFTPGKSKKITGTILLLGVYSPFTQFYEGKWWDSGILLVPFSSWDYSITKKFKYNISFSGTYEWNKNMLNYQVLTGGKILL
jgi:hypothetical protein